MKKIIAFLIIGVLLSGALIGCKSDTTIVDNGEESLEQGEIEMKIDKEQKFVFSDNSAVIGLNPLLNTTAPDNGLHDIILETLVRRVADEDGGTIMEPAVAERWDISQDGTVYTFFIRENALWHDGVPVTAHDFVYTYQQMANPKVGSTNAWLFDGIIVNFGEALYDKGKKPEDIGVRAIDDRRVEFTLVKPYSYFLDLLNGARPVRQDKFEEWGSEYGSSMNHVVMNGPFIIESWDQNVQMTLVKNEKYWDADNVKLDKVVRKVITEPQVAVQALLAGEIDVVRAREPEHKMLMEREGNRFRTIETIVRAPEFYGFNAQNKYFKNPKIRLAFSLGFDREKYVNDIIDGAAVPLYSLMPPVMSVGETLYTNMVKGENEIIKHLQKQYTDPKALLIEGLIEEGFDPDPSKMEVRLATRGTSEFSKRSSEWMLQQWRENLGVTIIIDMMEWNIMWDRVGEGDYDISTAGWGPYYNDPNGLLSIYHPEIGYFDSAKSGWVGPDADRFKELLELASNTPDLDERAQLYLDAEKLLVGTGIISPTYTRVDTTYVADYAKDYIFNTHASVDYRKIYISGKK
ncbi:peptide ABC transporter substrate-binding protein [Alkaliphilus peptidifermentans]|uniref:Oligopeptide transport system substrate-binding protein n=1 Tax=Alkaliphilus peptidifermentans DSM 18978 TaxID=1120976 RepID=A0A1G5L1J9_9FIRM|nr:peptide ABC transporter substrate-binding protein [Alkaliphilus peptidifermentans]SCZ06762.1 oligopeptide transport system substrate-binding protein [Alkaliphilus peptidifermentans DSM 18978]